MGQVSFVRAAGGIGDEELFLRAGPEPNVFSADSLAAARALRDAHANDPANTEWAEEYLDGAPNLFHVLRDESEDARILQVFKSRVGSYSTIFDATLGGVALPEQPENDLVGDREVPFYDPDAYYEWYRFDIDSVTHANQIVTELNRAFDAGTPHVIRDTANDEDYEIVQRSEVAPDRELSSAWGQSAIENDGTTRTFPAAPASSARAPYVLGTRTQTIGGVEGEFVAEVYVTEVDMSAAALARINSLVTIWNDGTTATREWRLNFTDSGGNSIFSEVIDVRAGNNGRQHHYVFTVHVQSGTQTVNGDVTALTFSAHFVTQWRVRMPIKLQVDIEPPTISEGDWDVASRTYSYMWETVGGEGSDEFFRHGPEQYLFRADTLQEAKDARASYARDPANAGWLAEFDEHQPFMLTLLEDTTNNRIAIEAYDEEQRTWTSVYEVEYAGVELPAKPNVELSLEAGASEVTYDYVVDDYDDADKVRTAANAARGASDAWLIELSDNSRRALVADVRVEVAQRARESVWGKTFRDAAGNSYTLPRASTNRTSPSVVLNGAQLSVRIPDDGGNQASVNRIQSLIAIYGATNSRDTAPWHITFTDSASVVVSGRAITAVRRGTIATQYHYYEFDFDGSIGRTITVGNITGLTVTALFPSSWRVWLPWSTDPTDAGGLANQAAGSWDLVDHDLEHVWHEIGAVTGAVGLDESEVEAVIRRQVERFATIGDTTTFPLTRFGDGSITQAKLHTDVQGKLGNPQFGFVRRFTKRTGSGAPRNGQFTTSGTRNIRFGLQGANNRYLRRTIQVMRRFYRDEGSIYEVQSWSENNGILTATLTSGSPTTIDQDATTFPLYFNVAPRALEVAVDASGFDGNLATTDDTVQKVAQKLDDLTITGGGSGTDDQTAAEVTVDAEDFDGNLSTSDTDVQTALETIDGLSLGGTTDYTRTLRRASSPLNASTSWDAVRDPGIYLSTSGSHPNAPFTGRAYQVLVLTYGGTGNEVWQMAVDPQSRGIKYRTYTSSTWSAWADMIPTGGGTGTDDQTAAEVSAATGNFDGLLSSSDDTVQKALETLDEIDAGDIDFSGRNINSNLARTSTNLQAVIEWLDDVDLSADGGTLSNAETVGDGDDWDDQTDPGLYQPVFASVSDTIDNEPFTDNTSYVVFVFNDAGASANVWQLAVAPMGNKYRRYQSGSWSAWADWVTGGTAGATDDYNAVESVLYDNETNVTTSWRTLTPRTGTARHVVNGAETGTTLEVITQVGAADRSADRIRMAGGQYIAVMQVSVTGDGTTPSNAAPEFRINIGGTQYGLSTSEFVRAAATEEECRLLCPFEIPSGTQNVTIQMRSAPSVGGQYDVVGSPRLRIYKTGGGQAVPTATSDTEGIVELATAAEARGNAIGDANKAISVAVLRAEIEHYFGEQAADNDVYYGALSGDPTTEAQVTALESEDIPTNGEQELVIGRTWTGSLHFYIVQEADEDNITHFTVGGLTSTGWTRGTFTDSGTTYEYWKSEYAWQSAASQGARIGIRR